jgi:hypothetical protein
MSNRKNHHFVPQFYFRRFSSDERSICALTKTAGALIEKASIKSQASRDNFYGSAEIESALGDIEGACSATLRNLETLNNPMRLDAADFSNLLLHLSLQRTRTLSARENMQPIQDNLIRTFAEAALRDSKDLDEETRAELLENLPHLGADPVGFQRDLMRIAVETTGALGDLLPIMLINRTSRPFIFSDAPVIYYNALCKNVRNRGVLGVNVPGLLVFLPLSASKCLMLADAANYKVLRVRDGSVPLRELRDVAALNKLQIHAASNCVYFGEFKYAKYVQALWQEEKHRIRPHLGVVREIPTYDPNTRAHTGKVLHGFEPQLPFPLSLSFLVHEVLDDSMYCATYRRTLD